MDYVNKLKKEPRFILNVLSFIFLFLPWVGVSVNFFGIESVNASGFRLIGNSFSMILLLLINLFLLAMPFIPVPALQKFKKLIYPGASLLAIILMFIATSSEATSSYVYRHVGFWLTLLSYLGVLALTFIIDFNINRQSFQENGVQGVFTNIADQVTNTAADNSLSKASKNIVCASCNTILPTGTKFCSKCGTPVPEVIKCANCGTEIPAGAAFCAGCGTKVE